MKISRRFLPAGILCAWLLLPPLSTAVFTSCRQEPASINITMVSDYSQLLEALGKTNQTLTDKLSLVEAALSQGFAGSQDAGQMLAQALSALSGTTEEKLAQIEAAVKSQTASLELKLALIEAAVTGGFADEAAQQALTLSAIQTLSGTMDERLAAIGTAIKSQTAGLEAKLTLIETAVKEGLTDETDGLELLKQAVYSLTGTSSERLLALEKAVVSQGTTLSSALALIETALDNRLADANDAMNLLLEAVKKLDGTLAEQLSQIEEAIKGRTSGLETKLGLIEAAVKAGWADQEAQQKLLKSALESLDGTLKEQLSQMEAAISSQTTSLSSKLGLIGVAVEEGMAAEKEAEELIQQAVASLDGTVAQRLSEIDKAVCSQTLALWTKLDLIETALKEGLSDEAKALGQIEQALSTSLKDGLDSVMTALNQLNLTMEDQVTVVLRNIAIALSRDYDYRSILWAIQRAVDELSGVKHLITGHEYVEMGNGLKWATCNVGATRPEESGDYFAWAETAPYYQPGHAHDVPFDDADWKDGKSHGYADTSNVYFNIATKQYTKYIQEGGSKLEYEDDAARQNWGGTWRMPTESEWSDLLTMCDLDWTDNYNGTGVAGMILTSRREETLGNQIFLPAAGYWDKKKWYEKKDGNAIVSCWTSSSVSSSLSKKLDIVDGVKAFKEGDRNLGCSVRPVSN